MFSTEVLSLETVLEDPSSSLFKEFAAYLHQSYCIENLAFWLATQEYHQECNDELCESMINLYIRPNSPQEINIPCDMRQAILDFYHQRNCHVNIFDEAAEAVLELMRVNSFLPWITSSWPSFDQWSLKKSGVNHSPSLSALSSITDKWNMIKSKQLSRRSCSSLDYNPVDDTLDKSTTRYRSMLKRVKRSLLGHHSASSSSSNEDEDDYSTPRSSFTEWRKSQR
jgi:hypothetical protein